MKFSATYKRILLLGLWLICGMTVVGLQSGRYFYEPLAMQTAPTQEAEQEQKATQESDKQAGEEQNFAQITIASEALLPILKTLPQPVIFQIMELAVIEEISLPVLLVQPVAQAGYFKILFRQIISPNAP